MVQTTQDHIDGGRHVGIDIGQAGCGYPILAADAGTVRYAQIDPGTGAIIIVLQHAGGLRTAYVHENAENVYVGQAVVKGQKIGISGDTGHAIGCHLHFEVRKRNALLVYVAQKDAWHYLGQNRVKVNLDSYIRSAPRLADSYKYAKVTAAGVVRLSDGKVIFPAAYYFALQGDGAADPFVTGEPYLIGGVKGDQWAPIWVGGILRYAAKSLVVRGAANI